MRCGFIKPTLPILPATNPPLAPFPGNVSISFQTKVISSQTVLPVCV